MSYIVYEVEDCATPISNKMIEAWKEDTTHRVILVSTLNLAYLQGLKSAIGVSCDLVGSDGKEIQLDQKTPMKKDFNNIFDAVKWIQKEGCADV